MKKLCLSDSKEIDQLILEISNLFEKKALRGFQNKFKIESLRISRYRKYFFEIEDQLKKQIAKDKEDNNILGIQTLKKNLRLIQNDYLKMQNKSKIINVNPLFNDKKYLGKFTEPKP
jgi:hypothetical protein